MKAFRFLTAEFRSRLSDHVKFQLKDLKYEISEFLEKISPTSNLHLLETELVIPKDINKDEEITIFSSNSTLIPDLSSTIGINMTPHFKNLETGTHVNNDLAASKIATISADIKLSDKFYNFIYPVYFKYLSKNGIDFYKFFKIIYKIQIDSNRFVLSSLKQKTMGSSFEVCALLRL